MKKLVTFALDNSPEGVAEQKRLHDLSTTIVRQLWNESPIVAVIMLLRCAAIFAHRPGPDGKLCVDKQHFELNARMYHEMVSESTEQQRKEN